MKNAQDSPLLFSSAVPVTARCNTTGPLAEVEARGQRAAAQSDPEVLDSAAEKSRQKCKKLHLSSNSQTQEQGALHPVHILVYSMHCVCVHVCVYDGFVHDGSYATLHAD